MAWSISMASLLDLKFLLKTDCEIFWHVLVVQLQCVSGPKAKEWKEQVESNLSNRWSLNDWRTWFANGKSNGGTSQVWTVASVDDVLLPVSHRIWMWMWWNNDDRLDTYIQKDRLGSKKEPRTSPDLRLEISRTAVTATRSTVWYVNVSYVLRTTYTQATRGRETRKRSSSSCRDCELWRSCE